MSEKMESVIVDSGRGRSSLRDAHRAASREMVKSAAARGEVVTGPGGLLADLTEAVVETMLLLAAQTGYESPS